MSDSLSSAPTAAKTGKGLLLGVVGALVLGGGGFAVTFLGLIPSLGHGQAPPTHSVTDLPTVVFLPVDPVTISLGPTNSNRHLRFASQLEIEPGYTEEVQHMMPRIVDVLNGYLRAIEVSMIENPAMLMKIKAQMLRRIQIVTGEGRVHDLLISEFILN